MIIRKIEYQTHIFISAMLRSIDLLRYHVKLISSDINVPVKEIRKKLEENMSSISPKLIDAIDLYHNDNNILLEDCVPTAKQISKKLRFFFKKPYFERKS